MDKKETFKGQNRKNWRDKNETFERNMDKKERIFLDGDKKERK